MAKEMTQPTEEQIRDRAYQLWEADGRQPNRDWEYWLKAQQELHALTSKPAVSSTNDVSSKKASSNGSAGKTTKRRSNARATVYA